MELFGYEIKRSKSSKGEKSFVAPSDDGSLESIKAVVTTVHTLISKVLLITREPVNKKIQGHLHDGRC